MHSNSHSAAVGYSAAVASDSAADLAAADDDYEGKVVDPFCPR